MSYDRLEHLLFLFADVVENINKIDKKNLTIMMEKIRKATKYNKEYDSNNIEDAISYLENEIWNNLYGKNYNSFFQEKEKTF